MARVTEMLACPECGRLCRGRRGVSHHVRMKHREGTPNNLGKHLGAGPATKRKPRPKPEPPPEEPERKKGSWWDDGEDW